MQAIPPADTSRQDTTHAQAYHLAQLPLGADLGRRSWVHRALTLRVAESRQDRAEVAEVVRHRHYLACWPAPPRTLLLSYIGSLGGDGAAAVVMVALLPINLAQLRAALGLHPCSVLTLTRCWRADDLGPEVAPDLMPETLRRTVKRLRADWIDRKCSVRMRAEPRLLVTWADPGVGHDGALYVGAGAVPLGAGRTGKLLFGWALDPAIREPLRAYGRAVTARARA